MERQDVEIIRGTTNTLEVVVTDADGNLYTPGADEVIIFGVKKRPEHEECVLMKKIRGSECAEGICTIELSPADTARLPFGKYIYDVGLRSGDDYHNIIPPSAFHIEANVTEWGDGA